MQAFSWPPMCGTPDSGPMVQAAARATVGSSGKTTRSRLFFDPRNTRAKALPSTGRMVAYNIGSFNGPTTGSGKVSRRTSSFAAMEKGSGNIVNPDGQLTPGLTWATKLEGTVNRNNNKDIGWTSELIIPWAAAQNERSSGERPDHRNELRCVLRQQRRRSALRTITEQAQTPRLLSATASSMITSTAFTAALTTAIPAGGPINYAMLQFADRASTDEPRAITNLTASSVSGYGA